MLDRLNSLLRSLFDRSHVEKDMDSELKSHIELYTEDLIAEGLSPEEAARKARVEFGTLGAVKDECREALGLRFFGMVARNFVYTLRLVRRNPVFAASIIVTLALCIGVNTALFSVVDAVLFRPLPYPAPERLAQVTMHFENEQGEGSQVSQTGSVWEGVRAGATDLDSAVFTQSASGVNFALGDQVEYLQQQRVSTGFFRVLGVLPMLGRGFTGEEDREGGPAVAILSHATWSRLFARDPSVLDSRIPLRGEPHTVVGVMPDGFETNVAADIWTPVQPSTTGEGAGNNYSIVTRLPEGVTWPRAEAEIASVGELVIQGMRVPDGTRVGLRLVPLQGSLSQDVRGPLMILWGAVGVVLLMGCVNIASLLLSRIPARTKELATRIALGGGKSGIVGQMLTESLVLALAGGIAGVGAGYLGIYAFKAWVPPDLNIWQTVQLDGRVLLVTLVVSVFTSVLFGSLPALYASRLDVQSGLTQGEGRGVAGRRMRWPHRVFVVGEIAMGFVLLTGAGLLIQTFLHLVNLDPGFEASNLWTAKISLQDSRYDDQERVNRLFDESLSNIRTIRGVEAASVSLCVPYERPLNSGFVRLDGPDLDGRSRIANVCYVTPGYFETLRIPVRSGRDFERLDSADEMPVVIVNETFARQYLSNQEAVGSHLEISESQREVVGVVGNVPFKAAFQGYEPLDRTPVAYIPAQQSTGGFFSLVHTWFSPAWFVRTRGSGQELIEGMQHAVEGVDPLLPFSGFSSMDQIQHRSVGSERFLATLLSFLGGLSLVLAAVGVYGLIANSVVERTRELSIRMAMGATPSQAVRSVAQPGLVLGLLGVSLGVLLAQPSAQLLRSLVWVAGSSDGITFVVVAAVLLFVAVLASFLPALRIVRLNPAITLRHD